jgi:hypothetical protein
VRANRALRVTGPWLTPIEIALIVGIGRDQREDRLVVNHI